MRGRIAVALAVFSLFLASVAASQAATVPSGTVSPSHPSVSWEGQTYPFAIDPGYPTTSTQGFACGHDRLPFDATGTTISCDKFELQIDVPPKYWDTHGGGVLIRIEWADAADDFDVYVHQGGALLGDSSATDTNFEEVFLTRPFGTYRISVYPTLVTDSGYTGTASFVSAAPPEPTPVPPELKGPCTDAAALSMPDGHDHNDPALHDFACGLELSSFLSLQDELAARPEAVLGEMDVENDIAAVSVTYPEAGVLFFDVSNPAEPKYLSWYRGPACTNVPGRLINCGAFVDLSADGTIAFLSIQNYPGPAVVAVEKNNPRPGLIGVEVIDIRNPKKPRLAQAYPILGKPLDPLTWSGVHTSRSHTIPPNPTDPGPRAAGEYLFSITNGYGIAIAKVSRIAGLPILTPVARIPLDDEHDTFIQNDPLDGRTYLYIAGGFETGFLLYDVTDPARPVLRAEWDLTPECSKDWYAHTLDVAIRNGKRFVTLDAETFKIVAGSQSAEDQALGCGALGGNGDQPAPLWIVDATDLSTLGPAHVLKNDEVAALKSASEEALVATWTNPASRDSHSGILRFSIHNQQIDGDRIYLSHYHGGIYVLDASEAFQGLHVRPRELAVYVPHQPQIRPAIGPEVLDVYLFLQHADHPTIWDMVYYNGYILSADEYGGFYSLRYTGAGP